MAKGRKAWWRKWERRTRESIGGFDHLADVRNLYSNFGLEPSNYQRFDEPPPAPSALVDERRTEEFIAPAHLTARAQPMKVERETMGEYAEPIIPEPTLSTHVDEEPSAPRKPGGGFTHDIEFSPSGSKFPLLHRLENDIQRHEATLAPVIGLVSYTGGVGKSTLAAALGAAFARLHHRCVLVGQTPYSPLAYYFGGPELSTNQNGAAIIHYSQAIEGGGKPVDLVIGDAPTQELIHNVRQRASQAAVVVMDMEASPGVAEDLPFFDMAIVPVRPDVNSLVMIERLERALEETLSPPTFGTWYLLNQFDAGRELHVQVHETLRRRLGGRLLPFSLPLDNSVQEALASGQPPQVYKAYTPFSRAIDEFESWLEEQIQPASQRNVVAEND